MRPPCPAGRCRPGRGRGCRRSSGAPVDARTPRLRGGALGLALGLLLRVGPLRLGLLGRGLRGRRWRFRLGGSAGRRLLPAASTAGAAAALGVGIGCRALLGGGRVDGYGVGGNGSGSRDRRLLVGCLATEPAQAKSPSWERATASPDGAGRRARCWMWTNVATGLRHTG